MSGEDEATKAELKARIERLEELVEPVADVATPSRRQVLTGLVGAGAFALGSSRAAAADTTDGRHAAKFGQYAQLEDPGGDTWATIPDSGAIDLGSRGLTGVGSLSTAEMNDTYVADPDASDIGTEINDIHDNDCSTGDAIFVPPGEYHNQNTKIDLSKDITLYSTGDWRSPGARIYKQSDIESIRTLTGSDRAGGSIDESINLIGLMFSGADVADTSHGARIRGIGTASIASHDHGNDGVHVTTESKGEADADCNGAILDLVANGNGRDGVRTVSTGGGINMNAMKLRVESNENAGMGLNNIDGYSWRLWLWAQSNGGKGFDLTAAAHDAWVYSEANGTPSTAPGGRITLHSGIANPDIDNSSFGTATVLKKGDTIHMGSNQQMLFNSPTGQAKLALQEGATGADAAVLNTQNDVLVQTDNASSNAQNVLAIGQTEDSPDLRIISGDGKGVVVTTPDGTDTYRIRVDNSGNVVTDGPL